MATLAQKIAAEEMVREMIAEQGLPEPDDIEYGFTCIRVLWNEPKLALVVDIDPPPEDDLTATDGNHGGVEAE